MCCGGFIAKYLLFFTNLVFSLAGLVILGLGIAILLQIRDVQEIIPVNVVPISVIVLGAVIFLIAFLACCGAIKQSRCMLIMYAICMTLLAALKVYLSVVIFSFLGAAQDTLVDWVQAAFDSAELREAFHAMESMFGCCGTVGSSSYDGQALPPSCCATPVNDTCFAPDAHPGCNYVVTDYFDRFGAAVGSVLIVIIVIEVALIIIACFLSHRISKNQKNLA